MSLAKKVITLTAVSVLSACAAMLVPETDDPLEKLGWAEELYDKQERPLPAERLIVEAIDICADRQDHSCLGKAYKQYGFFFRSPSIRKWEKIYREQGFYDEEATYENRLDRSLFYFEQAIAHFSKTTEYDQLAGAYLNLGFAYYFLGEYTKECEPYEKSLEYHKMNVESAPDANIVVPEGVANFEEYLQIQQERAGC